MGQGFKGLDLDRISVIQRLKDRLLTQVEAGSQLGLSERQVRRLVRRSQSGFDALAPRHRGGNRLIAESIKHRALSLIKEKYVDFGPTFAAEKLEECEGIKVSRETLRCWMMAAGLWKGRKRKRAQIHQSRERRPCLGELVQIDGSPHDWFEGRGPKCCLLVFIDDATGQIEMLYFCKSETTLAYMDAIGEHIRLRGRPLAYYSDKHSIFKTTREQSVDGLIQPTHLHRALTELKIELICAHSPQAKGRVERANQTLQDRLIKEMRLKGISTLEQANAYAPKFIAAFNKKFGVIPESAQTAYRPVHQDAATVDRILSVQLTRKLSKNLEFSLHGCLYQILTQTTGYRLRHKTVTICEHADGRRDVLCDGTLLAYKTLSKKPRILEGDSKDINGIVDELVRQQQQTPFIPLPTGSTSPPAQLSL